MKLSSRNNKEFSSPTNGALTERADSRQLQVGQGLAHVILSDSELDSALLESERENTERAV